MKKIFSILILLALIPFALASMDGTETMTRTGPSTVSSGQSFTITYTAVGTSGAWGASIEESVSGGCTFPSGSATYNTVILYEDGLTKTITMNAPSSGSCTFTGDYKYGTYSIKPFTALTVTVSGTPPSCLEDWGCGGWSVCSEGTQTRTCTDANDCGTTLNKPATQQTCGSPTCTTGLTEACMVGDCAGTKTCTSGTWGACVQSDASCGVGGDSLCQYFDWAPELGDIDSCVIGILIIIGGLVAFSKLMGK